MRENIIQVKSYAFAVRVVRLYQHLSESKILARIQTSTKDAIRNS